MDYIKQHLSIEVEGYYEPYSGQGEHYHKVTIITREDEED